jgi:hypothetical protein
VSILNPWVLLGMLVLVLGAYTSGHHTGYKEAWLEGQAEVAKLNDQARKTEEDAQSKLLDMGKQLIDANNQARVANEKARTVAAGSGFRVPIVAPACPVQSAADTPAPSGDQPQPTAELDPAVGNALFDLAAIGDEAIRNLNACIAAYDQVREMYSK